MSKLPSSLLSMSLMTLLAVPVLAASPAAPKPDASATPTLRACELLTSDDIRPIQGETVTRAIGHESSRGAIVESQCYFALPTAAKSISLSVTLAGEGKGSDEMKNFRDAFHRKPKKKHRAPIKIAGLGDEAFWAPSASGGNLYAFKAQSFVRISIGGTGDQERKLEDSKTLVRKVLARL